MDQQPTPYADVNAVVLAFLADARAVLGEHLRGMYLAGSLALGDFTAQSSDIDFVVVTDIEINDELLSGLQAMHERFNASASSWATEVEAAYISLAALRRYDPALALHPHIERGAGRSLAMEQFGEGWIIQYFILREHGIIVAGPAPRELIDPISAHDLRCAVVTLMDEWWSTMLSDPTPLQYVGYQVYAVLTMCRILYTLATGSIASKPVAARWAQETLAANWSTLIERALAWRKDRIWDSENQTTSPADLAATQELIRFTLAHCQP